MSAVASIKDLMSSFMLAELFKGLRITGNFQMWRDLLGNRTDKAAQWEVRAVATEIQRQLAQHAPLVFS